MSTGRTFLCSLLIGLVGLLLARCGTDSRPGATEREVKVFAAASLTEALTDLGNRYEAAHPGATVTFSFAGSQQLAQQIAHGAPADVFASADLEQVTAVQQAGKAVRGAERAFAHNELVVIYPKTNPARIQQLHDLARPGVKVDVAAPEVPVGQYTLQLLEAASQDPSYGRAFRQGVLSNIVSYEESVRAVLTKVRLEEADAGIVYRSDLTAEAAANLDQIEIPDHLNVRATYYITPITGAKQPDLAQSFVEFVLSSKGQEVLESHGFVKAAE